MSGQFETEALDVVSKAMNTAYYRHNLLLDNIANMGTPGHTYTDISFKDHLKQIGRRQEKPEVRLTLTDSAHIPETAPHPLESYPLKNYSETTLEQEMTNLMETTLFYSGMIQLRNLNSSLMRTVINEGRR